MNNILFVSVDGSHPDILISLADISGSLTLVALKKHRQSLEDRFRWLGKEIPRNINIIYLDSYLSYFNLKSNDADLVIANCPMSGYFANRLDSKFLFLMCQDFVEYLEVSRFNFVKKYLMIMLYRFILKKVCRDSQVLVLSNYLRKRAESYGARNVKVIPIYGVNMKLFKRKRSDVLRRKLELSNFKVILVVCRLSSEKGLKYLIDAFEIVKKDQDNVKLIFAGKGPLRSDLEDYVAFKGLNDIIFLGHIPYSELPWYYSLADIFVLPSLKEGLGLSIAEAMSCRVPIVASDTGGIPDLILNEKTGILVSSADSYGLAKAILSLLGDKNLSSKMVHNAYKYVYQNYEKKKVMDRFISFVRKL